MTAAPNCEICAFLPKNKPIFETNKWTISLAPDQGYLGRCYVTLKEHKSDMAELSSDEWLEFAEVVQKLEAGVREAFGATLFNWSCLMNNAFQVSPARPHVHWHVRPRYEKAVIFEGEEFVDPLFGHHYDPAYTKKLSDDKLSRIEQKIAARL